MAIITIPFTFSAGNTIIAAQHNSNFSTIYNDYDGNITDANISPTAQITYTKLSLSGTVKQSDVISTFNNNSGFGLVPSGGIIMWSGTIAAIPTGWFLCNGSNSTPDLRDRFIVAASVDSGGKAMTILTGGTSQSGGSVTITTSNMPAHTHTFETNDTTAGGGNFVRNDASSASTGTQTTASTGSGTAYTQPFYALAYIMKS